LLVNTVNKINIADKITRRDSVFVNNCFNLFVIEINGEESSCRGQSRDEFILNTCAFSQFIIIFEESFHSDLFFPYLGSNFSLYIFHISSVSYRVTNWDKRKKVRAWVPAVLKIDVISYIYKGKIIKIK